MEKNALFAALCALSLLALFGCPGGQPEAPIAPPSAGAQQPSPPVVQDVPVAWGNQTAYDPGKEVANLSINASAGENATVPDAPQETGPARGDSDRIGEGAFAIKKTPFEPLHIYVINDSHADSVLVTKGSFVMLVDAGEFGPVREMLDRLSIGRINVLAASRDYSGAIGGMADVLYSYPVDEFWENGAAGEKSAEYSSLLALVKEKRITVKHPQAGDNLTVNNLDIRVLNPARQRMNDNPDTDAIVLRLSTGKFCALLLNPTVQERENALMGTGVGTACPVATFFRHGEGRPVSSLIIEGNSALRDVIISVGENTQGLPSGTTLTRLEIKKYGVWRTDTNGSIDVYADWQGNYMVSAMNATG